MRPWSLRQPHGARQHVSAVPLQRQHRPQHAVHRLPPADRRVSELHAQHGRAALRHLRTWLLRRRHHRQELHQWVQRCPQTSFGFLFNSIYSGRSLKTDHCMMDSCRSKMFLQIKKIVFCFITECDCSPCGTESCDPHTGQCRCKPGVSGPRCEHCVVRWVLSFI